MPRGGKRTPKDPAAVSGPGALSKRTDGDARKQPIAVANVGDSEELKHGDRQRLEAAQRVAPLARAASPRLQQAPPPGPRQGGGDSAQLPDFLFGGESTRPDEPITEGLPFGPGGGPDRLTPAPPNDNRELMLQFLASTLGNQDAANMLNDYRNERVQARPAPVAAAPGSMEAPIEEEAVAMEDELGLPEEDLATEEEVAVEGDEEELSVETPEAAPSAEEGEPSPI